MKNNALNYHLAFALIALIKDANGEVYGRLNLTTMILGCTKAMKPNAEGLSAIVETCELLRESYEPEMDTAEYTYTKRIAFEIELDKAQADLLKIINDNNLVSQSVMQEVIAGRFNSEKQGVQE